MPLPPISRTWELVIHHHGQAWNLSKPPLWGLEPGHAFSQLPPLQLSGDETDLKAQLGVHHKANPHWGWMPTTLRLVKVEGTVVLSGHVLSRPVPTTTSVSIWECKQVLCLQEWCLATWYLDAWQETVGDGQEVGKHWGHSQKAQGITRIAFGGTFKRWHWLSMWFKESRITLWLPLCCLNNRLG